MTGQEEFDRKYITSLEICELLKTTRAGIFYARRRGRLPGAITVGVNTLIWKRDEIQPYLEAWRISRMSWHGELIQS